MAHNRQHRSSPFKRCAQSRLPAIRRKRRSEILHHAATAVLLRNPAKSLIIREGVGIARTNPLSRAPNEFQQVQVQVSCARASSLSADPIASLAHALRGHCVRVRVRELCAVLYPRAIFTPEEIPLCALLFFRGGEGRRQAVIRS